ncbi:MAG: hypothetical protein ABH891_08205 [Candidatus Omnitrophota bacterium]
MTFLDFLAEVQTLRIEELRAQSEEYFEAVISKADLDPLHKILTAYFGPPLKREGQSPSGEANQRAKPHGGIRKDQTMYFRQAGDHAECALLWPWGNGIRITVKIIQSKNSVPASD